MDEKDAKQLMVESAPNNRSNTANKVIIEELTIENGNKKIFGTIYKPVEEGRYPAVILSHGYNGTNSDFVVDGTYFAQNGYIAYAYDFCGGSVNSKSSGTSTDMTIFTEKDDLLAVFHFMEELDQIDSTNIFLLGGSQGGLVTTLTAEEIPDQVRGVILYYPALNIPNAWRQNFSSIDEIPETVDFWGLTLGKVFFTSIREFYTFDHIGSFPQDVLIIYGADDNIVHLDAMLQAQKAYDKAQLIILPKEGHGFSPEGGKEARELVLRFMKNHRSEP